MPTLPFPLFLPFQTLFLFPPCSSASTSSRFNNDGVMSMRESIFFFSTQFEPCQEHSIIALLWRAAGRDSDGKMQEKGRGLAESTMCDRVNVDGERTRDDERLGDERVREASTHTKRHTDGGLVEGDSCYRTSSIQEAAGARPRECTSYKVRGRCCRSCHRKEETRYLERKYGFPLRSFCPRMTKQAYGSSTEANS